MKTFLFACFLGCLVTGMVSHLLFLASVGDLEKHDPKALGRLRKISFPGLSSGYQPFLWQIRELSQSPAVANRRGLRLKLSAAWIGGAIGASLALLLFGVALLSLVLELV